MTTRFFSKIKTYCSFGLLLAYVFLILGPVGTWYSLIPGLRQRRQLAFHRHIRRFFYFYSYHGIWGVKPEVRNPNHETFKKPALIIANHQSILDLPATLMLHDKIVVMCGQWVWDSKLYGGVVRFADFMPSSMPMEQMVEHCRDCMSRGYSVLIFPEGTRSEDCQVHKFRRGAFHLAEQLQCDVIPVTLYGTGYLLPKNDFCLRKGRMLIDVGERVAFGSGLMGQEHGTMTRYWHKWFVEHYAKLEAEFLEDEKR